MSLGDGFNLDLMGAPAPKELLDRHLSLDSLH